jgi:hypothetical protein
MGLFVVLIFWAAVGAVLGSISAGVLAATTWFLTRGVAKGRRTVLIAASLLPFACLAWAGVVFVFQAAVNEGLLHRDLGLGDGWHAPLPNGYEISFIDVTDQGSICPVARGEDGCENSPSVSGVRSLQVTGHYLLGAADSQWFQHLGQEVSPVDQFFVLDTRDGKKSVVISLGQLRTEAARLGAPLHLEPIYAVYSRYRFTWFDIVAGCMLALPPLAALIALGMWIFRLRRNPRLTATAT